jgi:hypothetical protein
VPMPEKGKIENRRYTRVKPTGRISPKALLILDPKLPAVECKLIDISAGGACLEIPKDTKLPRYFTFFHGGTRKYCSVAWQKNQRVGICF